jgi:hypothetical protein
MKLIAIRRVPFNGGGVLVLQVLREQERKMPKCDRCLFGTTNRASGLCLLVPPEIGNCSSALTEYFAPVEAAPATEKEVP